MAISPRTLTTTYTQIEWSADRRTVTKTRRPAHDARLARRVHTRYRFCHGDLTARNVLRDEGTGELVLIDWEWAGLYPPGYELAFLWFSLVDVPDGRERVEQHLRTDAEAFLLSALLVQLWHLQWYVPPEFSGRHLATRDDLVRRLLRA